MYKRLFAFVIALALSSFASAQQQLSLDVQLLKLGVKGSQDSLDIFSVRHNEAMSITGLPEFSMRSGRLDFRSKFTPRFSFDFGNENHGWTATAWGFRQTVGNGSENSSAWRTYSRLEAASIDVAYRTKVSGGFNVYAGIKTAYTRMEESTTVGSIETQDVAVASGGVGPLVGISYSVKVSQLEMAASISQSLLGMCSQSGFRDGHSTQSFGKFGLASITEGSARVSMKLTDHVFIGLGAFFSSWHGITVINKDSKPSRQGITFGGGLASIGFSF